MDSLNPTVRDLHADFVDANPRTVDWNEIAKRSTDDDSAYCWAEVVTCPHCEKPTATINGSLVGHGGDEECPGSGEYAQEAEGPMMAYFYPCEWRGATEDAAMQIAHLPLCVVEIDGEKGLALTGGGMDLSWEICESYIRLGFLPPVHFTLPNMASRGLTERALLVLDAMEASLDVVARRAQWAREDVRRLRADYGSRALGPTSDDIADPGEEEIALALANRVEADARWTLEPGRVVCRDGAYAFRCSREGSDISPSEADDLARRIVDLLNAAEGE